MRRTTFVASAVLAVAAGYATAQTAPASVMVMRDMLGITLCSLTQRRVFQQNSPCVDIR